MNLVTRPVRPDDFDDFYQCVYTTFGFDQSNRQRVEHEWSVIRSSPTGIAFVVEDLDRSVHEKFVGYSEGVFVSRDFSEWMKTGVAPYFSVQIANNMPHGTSSLLSIEDIQVANSSNTGVCFWLAYVGWRAAVLTEQEAYLVRTCMSEAFKIIGIGHNYGEILMEVVGDQPLKRAQNAGFRLCTDYASYYQTVEPPPAHLRPYLLHVTREAATGDDGSLLSLVFAYRKPIFYFSLRDQALLNYALLDTPEEQIAVLLDRSVSNVNRRWQLIYDRVESVLPGLLPYAAKSVRVSEKKRLLLAYLRKHPEELRPHKRPPIRR